MAIATAQGSNVTLTDLFLPIGSYEAYHQSVFTLPLNRMIGRIGQREFCPFVGGAPWQISALSVTTVTEFVLFGNGRDYVALLTGSNSCKPVARRRVMGIVAINAIRMARHAGICFWKRLVPSMYSAGVESWMPVRFFEFLLDILEIIRCHSQSLGQCRQGTARTNSVSVTDQTGFRTPTRLEIEAQVTG